MVGQGNSPVDAVDSALARTRDQVCELEGKLKKVLAAGEAAVAAHRAGEVALCRWHLAELTVLSRSVTGNGRLAIELTEALIEASQPLIRKETS